MTAPDLSRPPVPDPVDSPTVDTPPVDTPPVDTPPVDTPTVGRAHAAAPPGPVADGTAGRGPVAPVDLVLEVTEELVRLRGPGIAAEGRHYGVRPGLSTAVFDVRRHRAQVGAGEAADGEVALGRAGRLLAESFLPEPVAAALGTALARAAEAGAVPRLGVRPGPWGALPWECLPHPATGQPLALCPDVVVYRLGGTGAVTPTPGPLRIVVAIAAPEGLRSLDHERELRNILAAVRHSEAGAAQVRIVPFATTAAIRAALERQPAHVLHLTGHGDPGRLVLEDDAGDPRPVTADELFDEAIPPGAVPPVFALSACHTAATAEGGESFAARLAERGAAVVIGTETSVTDVHATRFFADLYRRLGAQPDVVAAAAEARRAVQAELAAADSPQEQQAALTDEWAAVTVIAAAPAVPVHDPAATDAATAPRRGGAETLVRRAPGEVVGRRREQRRWPRELLADDGRSLVVWGIAGSGTTTLAAEVAGRVLELDPGRIPVSLGGPLTADGLAGAVAAALEAARASGSVPPEVAAAAAAAARPEVPSADRIGLLIGHVLPAAPLLVVLDGFEANLVADGVGHRVADHALAALLAAWAGAPGASRLLLTSRRPFVLPDGAERHLTFHQLPPLSFAESLRLLWSLPGLDRLTERQARSVLDRVDGHPRCLEHLQAELAGGEDAADDDRLDRAVSAAVDRMAAEAGLDALLERLRAVPDAERVLVGMSVLSTPEPRAALLFAVGEPDVAAAHVPDYRALNDRITRLLDEAGFPSDASVQWSSLSGELQERLAPLLAERDRLPVPPRRAPEHLDRAVAACTAAGLLVADGRGGTDEPGYLVPRWVADQLRRSPGTADAVRQAHAAAAAYLRWRVDVWPQDADADLNDLDAAYRHLRRAGDDAAAVQVARVLCGELHTRGARAWETALVEDVLSGLAADGPHTAEWLRRLGRIEEARGRHPEAEAHYRRALALDERHGDDAGRSDDHYRLAHFAEVRGDIDAAEAHYRTVAEIDERLGNLAGMAAAGHQLGRLAQLRGDYAAAEAHYRSSLAVAERQGNLTGMASAYHQLGVLAHSRAEYDEAERLYRESLAIDRHFGDAAGMAASFHQLGRLESHRGNASAAEQWYREALAIHERLDDPRGIAACSHQLGILAQSQGDYAEAERQYRTSLGIEERLGNALGMAVSYHQLGRLAELRHEDVTAAGWYREALAINQRLGHLEGLADNYHQLGILAQRRDDLPEAERLCRASLEIEEQLGNPVGMAAGYHQLGRLAEAREDLAAARAWYARALETNERVGNLAGLAATHHQLGKLAQLDGDDAEAERRYLASLDLENRLGNLDGAAESYAALAILRGRRERYEEAVSLQARALTIWRSLDVPVDRYAAHITLLSALRTAIDPDRFFALLTEGCNGADGAVSMLALLDEHPVAVEAE